ncbi:MAG: hypothetical protein COY53_02110 [Elusimicrobia bacterium CG_4_10_14_0_8_um_filter_37_32]|nr:MAG: hypothetical protein COY53_02110 [Elusimicrobia bacterium CG_4_10_14_0_8_um_filter_37_32]
MKKKNHINYWRHIVLESFCGRDFMRDKYTYFYPVEWTKDKKHIDWNKSHSKENRSKKIRNTCYVKSQIPKYCKNRINISCLDYKGKKCPFFLYADVSNEVKIKDLKEK